MDRAKERIGEDITTLVQIIWHFFSGFEVTLQEKKCSWDVPVESKLRYRYRDIVSDSELRYCYYDN